MTERAPAPSTPASSTTAKSTPAPTTPAPTTERAKLFARASVVGLGTLVSRVLGLARDMALAAVFSREATDAFFVAFTIPNALRQLLGEGAVSSAVVPVLSETLAKDGDEAAKRFFQKVRGVSLVALTVVTVLGVVFARPLTALFAKGYESRPEQFERTVMLTRIVFPYIFCMGTAALGMAALNAKRRFAVAAFAPGLLNVAFLVAAFVLPAPLVAMGVDPAYAMGIGALAGGVLQVVAQWPALSKLGFLARPVLDLRDPAVRQVFHRMAPMTVGIGIYYVDLVLSRRFLSEMGTGPQSYFTWASRICDLPQGIFSLALSTATLPALATLHAKGDREEFGRTFVHGLRLALFVAVPCSVALAVLGGPIVAMLFQRGEFDSSAARETARALAWQGGAVWTVAVVRQVVPAFHAEGDTRTPVVVSAVDLVAFIALALALRGSLGQVAISIAVAGSSFVQMALLLVALARRHGRAAFEGLGASSSRIVAASVIAVIAAWGAGRAATSLGISAAHGGMARTVLGGVACVVFAAVYLAAAWGMRSTELDEAITAVRRRRRRA